MAPLSSPTLSMIFQRWDGDCWFIFCYWARFRWWKATFHWTLAKFRSMPNVGHSIIFAYRFHLGNFLSFSKSAHFSVEVLTYLVQIKIIELSKRHYYIILFFLFNFNLQLVSFFKKLWKVIDWKSKKTIIIGVMSNFYWNMGK